ncbi:MAG TPA: DUF502 domain-containing protein [Gammaproteobacteria bacterium]|nr:DUF502 domain-containing protein [Gammaproteobacteria bacterium]
MMYFLQRYFISGLLIWLPLLVTILVIKFLVDLLWNILSLLPHNYQPDTLIGFHIPGIGVIITLAVIFLTGLIVANFIGRKLVEWGDALIARIPLVRTVYTSVKQVLETLFTPGGQSFRKVLLVEYPRTGMWTIAFQTGETLPEIEKILNTDSMISLYVPTTPNPTSGFLLIVPRASVIEVEMSVEQALKFVISLGVMRPNHHQKKLKKKEG